LKNILCARLVDEPWNAIIIIFVTLSPHRYLFFFFQIKEKLGQLSSNQDAKGKPAETKSKEVRL
jgi:hypothetical protein